MIKKVLGAFLTTLAGAGVALACGFHGYVPQETAVDRLLASDRVVLARPAAENPFRYEVAELLRDNGAETEIPFLVDSVTRRMLAANSNDAVLFARDAGDGSWHRLAYLDAALGPVMDEVLDRLEAWRLGGDLDRYQFFADLLQHPNPEVFRLALREMDRAPYPMLAKLDMTPDAQRLMRGLLTPETYGTLPIRVLLLGLSDDPIARDFLRRQFEGGKAPIGVAAGAFAVALVESTGSEGLAGVVLAVQTEKGQDEAKRGSLIEALAIHAESSDGPIVDEIRRAVRGLVAQDSSLAAAVARHFGRRADWSQLEVLDGLVSSGALKDPEALYQVEQYLQAATEALLWESN